MMEVMRDVEEWEALRKEAPEQEIIIFKFSPTCPVSHTVEREFDNWFKRQSDRHLRCIKIDVIRARPLSQHLAREFGIRHESPQVLWLDAEGQVKWSGSHHQITSQGLGVWL